MIALQQSIDINGVLQRRHIPQAAQQAGAYRDTFRFNGQQLIGWTFPLFDPFTGDVVGYFFKNADSNGNPKYLPRGAEGKGYNFKRVEHPGIHWYIPQPDTTRQAIAAQQGRAWLANGIPSLLAYRSAGMSNSIAGRAETSIPPDAADVLQYLGITTLYYPADNDSSGRQAAEKWRDVCDTAGIEFKPLQWPDFAHEGFDANDLLIHHDGDGAAFRRDVQGLKALLLPSRDKSPVRFDKDYDEPAQDHIQAVAQALGVWGAPTDSEGRVGPIANPIIRHEHDDTRPASYFYMQSGVLHDFKGDHRHSVWELADYFGIDAKQFYSQPSTPTPTLSPRQQVELELHAHRHTSEQAHIDHHRRLFRRWVGPYVKLAIASRVAPVLDDIAALRHDIDEEETDILHNLILHRHGVRALSPQQAGSMNIGEVGLLANVFHKGKGALIYTRLRDAYARGDIGPYIDAKTAAQVCGVDTRTVREPLAIMSEKLGVLVEIDDHEQQVVMNYIQHLEVPEVLKNIPPHLVSNSRRGPKPITYRLDFSHERARLSQAADGVAHARYHADTLAMPNDRMVQAAGGDFETLRQWRQLVEGAYQSDHTSRAQNRHYRTLFAGNNRDWLGLRALLERPETVSVAGVESVRDLRARLLLAYIDHFNDTPRRQVKSYLLGCENGELESIHEAAHIRTEARYASDAIDYTQLDNEIRRVEREQWGRVSDFRIEAPHSSPVTVNRFKDPDWREKVNEYAPDASRVVAVCRVSSTHVQMTEAEIAAKAQREPAQESPQPPAQDSDSPSENDPADKPTVEREKREIDPILSDSDPVFVRRQLHRAIERLTDCTIEAGAVVDSDGDSLATADCPLPALLSVLLSNAPPSATYERNGIKLTVPEKEPSMAKASGDNRPPPDDVYTRWKAQFEGIPF